MRTDHVECLADMKPQSRRAVVAAAAFGVACLSLLGLLASLAVAQMPFLQQIPWWLTASGLVLFTLLGMVNAAWLQRHDESARAGALQTAAQRALLNHTTAHLDDRILTRLRPIRSNLRISTLEPQGRHGLVAPAREIKSDQFSNLFPEFSSDPIFITGPIGSGKSTILRALAKKLETDARADLNRSESAIPVWLQLDTWRDHRDLGTWLLGELATLGIPKVIGQEWISNARLVLLLDALDDVFPGHRRSVCFKAINSFHESHKLIPIIVTCRSEACEALLTDTGVRLVELLALDEELIRRYLADTPECRGLAAVFKEDAALRNILRTPLLLNAVVAAYRDLPARMIRRTRTPNGWWFDIWSQYVDLTFEGKGASRKSDKHTTITFLSWLAAWLAVHHLRTFWGGVPSKFLSSGHYSGTDQALKLA